MILLFLEADERQHWWQTDASGAVIARGHGAPPASLLHTGLPVIAVPPLDAVSVHRIQLPRLAPAQAQAASRLLASELSAAPLDTIHTAITAPDAAGQRWLAICSLEAMTGWHALLGAQGIVAPLVPAPLLLPEPGTIRLHGLQLVHTATQAFAAEPDLATALLGTEQPPAVSEAALARSTPILDLHQGRFARSQRFQPPPAQLQRLAAIAAAAALLWLAGNVASWWQASQAASAAEAVRDQLAQSLLPPGTPMVDPRGQVAARMAHTGSGTASRLMAPLLASLAGRPGVSVAALSLDGPALTVTLETASPGDVAAIEAELRGQGLTTAAALPRDVAGRSQIELRVSRT